VDDAFGVRLFEGRGDLDRHTQGLICQKMGFDRRPGDILHHQIIRADIVDLANMRMVQRPDRTRLSLKSLGVFSLKSLNRHDSVQPRIACFPHLAHATGADRRKQHVRPERDSCGPGCHDLLILTGTAHHPARRSSTL